MENGSYNKQMEQDIQNLTEDVRQQNNPSKSQKQKTPARTMPTLEEITGHKNPETHSPLQSNNSKEFVHQMVEKIGRAQPEDRSSQMPSLNLADKILAQQRKIAALKRKSPPENNNQPSSKPEPVHINSMPSPPASPQQKIIADIVAKQIVALSVER
ncbi:MAG: hypothetical protein JW806_03285 [Sedimentisphaerales bacterium]|nr:hypothetical protein [Sedimentisphaerales bacterium]